MARFTQTATAVVVLLAGLAALMPAAVQAEVSSGTVSGTDLTFLGKFCFGLNGGVPPTAGTVTGTITATKSGVVFALYDDQATSWPAVYDNGNCDCSCRMQNAVNMQFWPLAANQLTQIGPIAVTEDVRPRFWYAAVFSCGGESYEATYALTWEQFNGSQFGVNEQGLFALYMVAFFVWGIGFGAQVWASRWLLRGRTFHPIIKIFTAAFFLMFLCITCLMIHWGVYGGNGVGVPFFLGAGEVLEVLARVTFLLLLLLIAKGWTISSTVLTERLQLIVAMIVILIVYLILGIWDLAGRDPATTVYVYDSAPGIIICVLQLLLGIWFAWRIRLSFVEEVHTEKKRFYFWFGIMFTLWFLLLPLIVLIGAVVSPWVRQKTVESLLFILNTVVYGVMMYLLWPSRATQYFEIQTDQFVASTAVYEDL